MYHSGLLDGTFCKLDIWIVVLKSRSIKPILSLVSFMIIVIFNVKGRLLICTSYDVLVKRFRSSLQYEKTNSLKMGRMLSNVFLLVKALELAAGNPVSTNINKYF